MLVQFGWLVIGQLDLSRVEFRVLVIIVFVLVDRYFGVGGLQWLIVILCLFSDLFLFFFIRGGMLNCMVIFVLVQVDRLVIMCCCVVLLLLKWVLLSELRYSLNDLDLIRFGEVYGMLMVVIVICGLLCWFSQFSLQVCQWLWLMNGSVVLFRLIFLCVLWCGMGNSSVGLYCDG